MTGTLLATLIPILTAPIMSRLFTAESYGILGLFMGLSGLIGVIAFSHYSQAILLTKENSDAKNIVWFAFFFSTIISVVTLVVLILLNFFTTLITFTVLSNWLYFLPLSIFFNGITSILLTWANRTKEFKQLSFNKVFQAILTAIVQIALGLLIKNETGLMVGLLLGQFISVLLLTYKFLSSKESGIGLPQLNSFKNIAIKYKNLLFYSTPSEFINNLINQTPIFLLQKFAGVTYVGYYNFTIRFLGMPQILLSSAIVDVFKQKASYTYNQVGNCFEIFKKTFKVLVLLAILPFIIFTFFAPNIFEFVFGSQWHGAGIFAQLLAVLFFFRFVVSPLTYVYFIVGKFKEDFLLHILFLIVTTLSFYLGNLFFQNKNYLILVYSLSYSSVYLIYLLRSYKFSKGILTR